MKKYFITSTIYAALSLLAGVFFREFTKLNNFTGVTTLGKVHVHLFALGTVMFILVAIISRFIELNKSKLFKISFILYNCGLGLTSLMFLIRGIVEVKALDTSKINGVISGFAGIGHIALGSAIILMLVSFILLSNEKKQLSNNKRKK